MSEIERATGMPRDEVRDLLPDWVAGRLEADLARRVEAAVRKDAELEREAETLAVLHRGRPRAPDGLEARILGAVREQASSGASDVRARRARLGRGGWVWGLAAAAVLALALGTLDLMERAPGSDPAGVGGLDQVAYQEVGAPWSDDATIAGAPVLDDLSEDALSTLLEELEG